MQLLISVEIVAFFVFSRGEKITSFFTREKKKVALLIESYFQEDLIGSLAIKRIKMNDAARCFVICHWFQIHYLILLFLFVVV